MSATSVRNVQLRVELQSCVCVGCTHVKFAKSSPQVADSWPCCCWLFLEHQVPGASPVARRSHATSKRNAVEIFHCVLEMTAIVSQRGGRKSGLSLILQGSSGSGGGVFYSQACPGLVQSVLTSRVRSVSVCFIRRRNPSVWNWSVPGRALTVNTD